MKLEQHREDVKYILNTLPRPLESKRPQQIAIRFKRLILVAEKVIGAKKYWHELSKLERDIVKEGEIR